MSEAADMVSRKEMDAALIKRHGRDFFERMRSASVAVAGLGGLGSNTAVMLARAGIGRLRLIDFDSVDITNLNRQCYTADDIGRKKTDALCALLWRINPYICLEPVCIKVTADNIRAIFDGFDITAEAFDKAEQKAMLVSGLMENFPAMKIVSGSGMAGYGDCNLIKTVRRFPNLYICGDGVSDAEGGEALSAARVAVCAGHQANKIIQIITDPDR